MKKRSPNYSVLKKMGKLCKALLIIIFLTTSVSIKAQRFVHPGVPFTRYDLDQLKQHITQEPWLSAYNSFKADYRSQLNYTMGGPVVLVSRAPNLYNNVWKNDMVAIQHLAFMYVFTGDSAYARKATNILDAWAVTNTTWGGAESMLDIGDFTDCWATGADILKGTFPGWTAANTQHVNNYFANVLFPTSFVPYPLRDANKGALQLKIALAAAAFMDDTTRFNQAIDVYRMDAGAGLRNSLTNGEVGDAGRDDHWRVQAAALTWGAEVAFKQGVDMYAELGNRVLDIGELYHKFAFVGNTIPFIPFGNYASYWTNWGIGPGARAGDMTNIIKAAYSLRKGIATPYTDTMRAALMTPGATNYNAAGGDFLFLKTSDTSTATVLPPVIYPGDNVQPMTRLTNLDIGNTGVAGSATYNSGTWTVKGAGTSLNNAFNYTFQKMKGNAGVVIKVENMTETGGSCGVMVRQSLTGTSYMNVQLNGSGGIGRHWQPKAPWWIKMDRVGPRIFGYHSQDGVNWTGMACWYEPNNFSDSLYFGFYSISNNTSVLNTATLTNVGFSQAAPTGSPEITSATAVSTIINTPFTYNTVATNTPTSYNAVGLPAGLSIDTATGIISGTPTELGTYTVTLTANNATGGATTILILTVNNDVAPAAPAGAAATVVNTGNVRISWTASANATSYNVKRSLTSGGPYTTVASGITGTSYIDVTPTPEVLNYYVVTALSGSLESGLSTQVSASVPPATPLKPTVTLGNGQLQLNWFASTGASTYNVKRSSVTGGPYTTIANVSGTSYTDASVVNGTAYYYVISAVGTSLQSGNSPEGFGVPGAKFYTWENSPLSENWSDTANWVERVVPTSPAILIFKNTYDSTLNNDLADLKVARILFDTTANGYTISGNSINTGIEIVNNSSSLQTFNTPLVLTENLTINSNTLDITFNGIISGTGNVFNIGRNATAFTALNTYSGNTYIRGNSSGGLSYGLRMRSIGTGTPSAPTSGPLGTGKIYLDGGTLYDIAGDAAVYNDIEVLPSRSYVTTGSGSLTFYGKITGNGTWWNDCNTYAGINLWGDNSSFTGYFVNALRSGNNRLRFSTPATGSANAVWNLDANAVDCQGINFPTGTISFGALVGRGYFRNNAGGAPIISVGALNTNAGFAGTINGSIGVEKVGTGFWEIGGGHTYSSPTIIRNGSINIINDPLTGIFVSPITVVGGGLTGTGKISGTVTVGTDSTIGAYMDPGNPNLSPGVGTFTTSGSFTMLPGAIFKMQTNYTAATADKMVAGSVVLNNATLQAMAAVTGTLPQGTNFTIIDNTGSAAVLGTFNALPEMSLVTIGGYDFRITYRGGTGNDVVLLDDRDVPVTITSAFADTALVGRAYSYAITAIKSPTSFSATGLPAGLNINTATGVISGTPTVSGNFSVTLGATNGTTSGTATLALVVKSSVVNDLIVASGDTKNIVEWGNILNLTYNVKRSTTNGGPYTTIASNLSTLKYTDAGVTNGSTYYYVVSTIDGGVENANSAQVIATPNLGQVDYYHFDDTTAARAIDAWGANHATLQVNATRTTGLSGSALKLDGTASSYATLPTGIASGLTNFTASIWLKSSAISNNMRILDFGNSSTQYMFISPQAGMSGTNSNLRFAIKTSAVGEQGLNASYAFTPNSWIHFAVTQTGTTTITTTLYVNGTQVATGTGNATASTGIYLRPSDLGATTQNYIGKSQFVDPILNGTLDEYRIYSRALSSTEISNIYFQYSPPVITSKLADTAVVNQPYTYTITASKPSTSFTATGLPSGLSLNATTGVISGTPTVLGTYSIVVTTTTTGGSGTATLVLVVRSNTVDGLLVAANDNKTIVEWNSIPGYTFNVKRATTSGGSYTNIATGLTTPRYVDATATNGNTYYYVVSSVANATENANSAEVAAKPMLGQASYYRFDEATGKGIDAWGAYHADLKATATRTTGYSGQALSLNKTATAYAQLQNGVVSGLSDFSISTWVKMSSILTWMRVFDLGTGTNQYMFLTVQAGLSGTNSIVRYAIKNGGAEQVVNYNYAFPLNTWVHMVVTQSGNTATLYINGTSVASNTGVTIKPTSLGTTTLNYLGKSQYNDNMFDGAIDEFRIYNRALSAIEISSLFSQVLPVTLTSYTATLQNSGAVLLNWNTATEVNNSHYLVERSTDGRTFSLISGNIAAKNTNGAAYDYTDYNPIIGANYYRLLQVDRDGKTTDLGIKVANVGGKGETWVLYPNPVVNGIIYLKNKSGSASSNVSAKLVNSAGAIVLSKTFNGAAGGTVSIALDAKLPSGHYILTISDQTALPVEIIR